MAFGLDDLMKQGTDLGTAYLKKEIADHGNKQPETRPDTRQVPSATVEKQPMTMKTKAMIGGGVLVGVAVLALLLKK